MSKRDARLFLHEMLQAGARVSTYLQGLEKADFEADTLVQDAVIRNLEIIGEVARQIPAELQGQHSEVPWRQIIGFRNVAIHAYFDVDLDIVWRICTENLQSLQGRLERMLEDLGGMPPLDQ